MEEHIWPPFRVISIHDSDSADFRATTRRGILAQTLLRIFHVSSVRSADCESIKLAIFREYNV